MDDDVWFPNALKNPQVQLLCMEIRKVIRKAEYRDRPHDIMQNGYGAMKALMFRESDVAAGEQAKLDLASE